MCADCAYYNMKTHKCTRGCTGEPNIENGDNVRFFTDCPLPNVAEVRHGKWRIIDSDWNCWRCTCCGEEWVLNDGNPSDNGMMFCHHCGARMDASCIDDESEAGA